MEYIIPPAQPKVVIPEAGIGYTMDCGCSAVHIPGTKTRIPRIDDSRPCRNHRPTPKIINTWSNL